MSYFAHEGWLGSELLKLLFAWLGMQGTPSLQELKLIYYGLLIRYHAEQNSYLEVCRCYRAIFETPSVGEDATMWMPILKKICWYVVLAPSSSDQITLLNLTAADKRLEQLPAYKELLSSFITQEVCLHLPILTGIALYWLLVKGALS